MKYRHSSIKYPTNLIWVKSPPAAAVTAEIFHRERKLNYRRVHESSKFRQAIAAGTCKKGSFAGSYPLTRQKIVGMAYGDAKKGPPLRAYVVEAVLKLSFRFDNAVRLPRVRRRRRWAVEITTRFNAM